MGEHKGSGLALICELFAGALTGGWTLQPEHPRTGGAVNNMLSVIIDPGALGDPDATATEAEAMVRTARQAKVREGFEEILMPGDPEAIQRRQRSEKGVDVDETSWQEILDAAENRRGREERRPGDPGGLTAPNGRFPRPIPRADDPEGACPEMEHVDAVVIGAGVVGLARGAGPRHGRRPRPSWSKALT